MFPTGLIPAQLKDKDNRDLLYSTLFKANRTRARRILLDAYDKKNQYGFGACAAFGVVSSLEPLYRRILSPLFLYNNAKTYFCPYGMQEQGTTGAIIMKAAIKMGVVDEWMYPYKDYKEPMVFPPISEEAYQEGMKNKLDGYVVIDAKNREKAINEILDNLAHGKHFVVGMTVGLTSYFDPEELPNGDAIIAPPDGTFAGHMMEGNAIDLDLKYTFKRGYFKGRTFIGAVRCLQSYGTDEERESEFDEGGKKRYTKTGYVWIPLEYLFGTFEVVSGHPTVYVNEIFVPFKDIPFDIHKIDAGDANIRPYIKNSRTMLPLRFIGEVLGMNVLFTEHDRGITITDHNKTIRLTVGSNKMLIDHREVSIDVPPEIKDSRTFVPIRAVAEAFEAEVTFFHDEQRIEIKKDDLIIEMWIGRNEARRIKRL